MRRRDFVRAAAAALALARAAAAADREAKGFSEVSCWRKHPSTNLLLKGRADRVTMDKTNSTVVVDLKTCKTGEAHPDRFSKTIWNWNYHRQAAFYLELFEASFFVFVAVENEPPYAVGVYNLDRESLGLGYRENERDLQRIKDCIETGNWPCYGKESPRSGCRRGRLNPG